MQSWKISYHLNERGEDLLSKITIIKGVYYPFYIKFIPEGTDEDILNFQRLQGILNISSNNNLLFTFSDYVHIDTYYSRIVKVYIGISCIKTIEHDIPHEIAFDFSNGLHTLHYDSLSIIVSTIKGSLPSLPEYIIPKKSRVKYHINSELLLNVDNIKLNVALQKEPKDAFIDSIEIVPSFNQRRNEYSIYGEIGMSTDEEDGQAKFKVSAITIKDDSTCYDDQTWSFMITNNLPIDIPKDIKSTLTLIANHQNNTISFQMTSPYNSLLVSCMISSNTKLFLSDEQIRNPKSNLDKQSHNLRFYQHFLSNTSKQTTEFTISFDNMNRYTLSYSVKCIFDTVHYDEANRKTESIIIGGKPDVDKKELIKTSDPETAQCVFWSFYDLIPSDFGSLSLDYCEALFARNAHHNGILNNRENNGCIQCTITITPYTLNEIGICASSIDICHDSFKSSQELKTLFESFGNSLNTQNSIKNNLNLVIFNLKKVIQVNDKNEINITGMTTIPLDIKNRSLSLKIFNTIDNPIECYSILQPITQNDISISLFDNAIKLLYSSRKLIASLTLPLIPDDKLYYLYTICYNYPGFSWHYKHTDPFKSLLIINSAYIPKEHEEVEEDRVDCQEESELVYAKCLYYTSEAIKLTQPLIFPSQDNELELFLKLSFGYKQIYIENLINQLNIHKPNTDFLNFIHFINTLLNDKDCHKDISYSTCRLEKKDYLTNIINILFSLYPCDDLIDLLSKNNYDTSTNDNIIRFVYTLFLLGNNTDAFTKESSIKFLDITNCFINKLPSLFNYFPKEDVEYSIIKDIIKILLANSANIIDLMQFLEADTSLLLNTTTSIILDDYIINYKKTLEHLYTISAKYEIKTFDYKMLHLRFITKDKIQSDNETIIINQSKITVVMNPIKLLELLSSKVIGLFFYDHYISFGVINKAFISEVVSLRFYQSDMKTNEMISLDNIVISDYNYYPKIIYNKSDDFSYSIIHSFWLNKYGIEFDWNSTELPDIDNESINILLTQEGDFTLGILPKPKELKLFRILSTFITIGVILIAGILHFLYLNNQKHKENLIKEEEKTLMNSFT